MKDIFLEAYGLKHRVDALGMHRVHMFFLYKISLSASASGVVFLLSRVGGNGMSTVGNCRRFRGG